MVSRGSGKEDRRTAVVTYLGTEGACAAAVALLRYPHAGIFPTSAYGLHHTLSVVKDRAFAEVLICGVGVKCGLAEVIAPLSGMRAAGVRVTWCCAGDYLDEFAEELGRYAQCRFEENSPSLPHLLADHLAPPEAASGRLRTVLAVAKAPEQPKGAPSETNDLVDLIGGSVWRFMNYRDYDAYPHAIRVLAAVEPLNEADRRTIASYRRSADRVLTGKTRLINEVRAKIGKCGPAEASVLVTGETGTGKEIVARLLHEASPRGGAAFVAVNCATLDGSLQQDMLFGHEKGAFTDARDSRPGCFEEADGGTLFLDEIGEITPDTQAKLLRVLQEGTIRRLGGRQDLHVDVRVIAATNRDLMASVQAGKFRADLYYRLAVLHIDVPPLRERKEDIPPIAADYVYRSSMSKGISPPSLNQRQLDVLKRHPWPGNIRELENMLERYIVLGEKDVAKLIDSSPTGMDIAEEVVPLEQFVARYIRSVFEQMGRNISKTAEVLGITRNTLKARIRGL